MEIVDRRTEWAACLVDPGYFCDNYGVIDDVQEIGDEPSGTMPFRLWPAQVDVMDRLTTERRIIILKARQLGISWLVCAYVLWLCLFHPMKAVLLFSKGQPEANELVRRIKALFDRLPDWLREMVPGLTEDNVKKLGWANGSWVQSMPATKNAGVSHTAASIVMDEAAHMMWGDQLYLNAKPTVDEGNAQLIVLSTANGTGNLFHDLWKKAAEGVNSFLSVFLPWWARPGRDQAWYQRVVDESKDPKTVPQNYPANATEAFLVSGRTRFEASWIAAQAANVRPSLPTDQWPESLRDVPGLAIYKLPVPGRRYLIAGDVAEGLEHGDWDDAIVIDQQTWEEVANLHGHWEQDEYAGFLSKLGYAYNTAPIYPERNNHGHAIITALKLTKYPRIGRGHDGRWGWVTSAKSKPEMENLIAAALRDGLIEIHSQATLYEMQEYRVLTHGTTGAPKGGFDDRVMAWGVGLACLRLERTRGSSAPAVGGDRRERIKPRTLPKTLPAVSGT